MVTQPPDEERVERVDSREIREEETKPAGGLKALAAPALVALIISFLVAQFYVMPNVVGVDSFTRAIGQVNTDVAAAKAAATDANNKVASVTGQIGGLNNSITSISNEITAIKQREAGFITGDKITALQAEVTRLTGIVNAVPNVSGDITQLKADYSVD